MLLGVMQHDQYRPPDIVVLRRYPRRQRVARRRMGAGGEQRDQEQYGRAEQQTAVEERFTHAGVSPGRHGWKIPAIASAVREGSGALRLLSRTIVKCCFGHRTMTLRKPMLSPECQMVSPVMRQPNPSSAA